MSGRETAMAQALRQKEHDEKYGRKDNDWQYIVEMLNGKQAQKDIAHRGENQGGLLGSLNREIGRAPNPADPFKIF